MVVFDEAQTLPPELLAPCLDALRHLTEHFGTTAVLCTATQPAVGRLDPHRPGSFVKAFNKIALDVPPDGSREIIRDVHSLFDGLRRTTIANLGTLPDQELANGIASHDRALCILNTKPHAARIFELLGVDGPANFHLSAQLSPAHRSAVLEEIRRRERAGEPCRVVATTVVEAGVDIDFPVVFRALTGLDSLAQAAGRCNRHGGLLDLYGAPRRGDVFFFTPADQKTPRFLTQNVAATTSVLPDHDKNPDDLILPAAIEAFFQQFYFAKGGWDRPDVLGCFGPATDSSQFPFTFDFKTAASRFRLIPDIQRPVIIPPAPNLWDNQDDSKSAEICILIDKLYAADEKRYPPPGGAHRKLQRHTVQIPKAIHAAMVVAGIIRPLCDDRFPVLVHPQNDYDRKLGLRLPEHADLAGAFIV